jgi:hypothetical protein
MNLEDVVWGTLDKVEFQRQQFEALLKRRKLKYLV